ncbi:hypothetical protein CH296_19740 [Rhodococcus sp. 14-2496-1d]|uniref:helix-turn-helix domain-containing protein n=1 Tax=Rhodococcus sp. 14-2496-1d TaxID=2023146 RepID=UPI000B9AD4D3|nr:hypothetical protein CH296_19740 [Rhodococcus sp. 14-2496-1d]
MARTPRRQTRSAQLARQLSAAELAFKQRLVKLRESRDLSQTEVARRMGVDKSAVSRFERIDANPRLSTIRAYALAIDASIEMDAHLNSPDVVLISGSQRGRLTGAHVSNFEIHILDSPEPFPFTVAGFLGNGAPGRNRTSWVTPESLSSAPRALALTEKAEHV